ncbi:AAA family ATPase [Leifsonia sp. YIM 134122]|uniref:AAA family ATPase n=1 Tax=Leifsonia stereocauli TaxID=3134136 RepID=A0ABU9VZR6_9MICO
MALPPEGLVARASELSSMLAALDRARSGTATSILIMGEPGVGKSTLMNAACDAVGEDAIVLRGRCLPLSSLNVPFLGLRDLLRSAPDGPEAPRPRLGSGDHPPEYVPVLFDDWIDVLCRMSFVVVAIDDLQWADRSTLDALMYLMSGPARALGIMATVRDGKDSDNEPIARWLADVRALPGVSTLEMTPFDRAATTAQLTRLLGDLPHESLVQDVFERTAGNPYLTTLVARGLPADARAIPSELPPDLQSTLRHDWHRLSEAGRELTTMLAIGGRPMTERALAAVMESQADAVAKALIEAVGLGILARDSDGRFWFHHPLIAEVVIRAITPGQARRRNARAAELYEAAIAAEETAPVDWLVSRAVHLDRAGEAEAALSAGLIAADAAHRVGGDLEMLHLLRRCIELRRGLPGSAVPLQDLLLRLRGAASETGAVTVELEAVDGILDGLDREAEPLLAAEMLVRRMHLRFRNGRGFMLSADAREALQLAEADPASWQYALALAELGHTQVFERDPAASATVDHAVNVAESSGNDEAIAYSLSARGLIAGARYDADESRRLGDLVFEASTRARDFWPVIRCAIWEGTALRSRRRGADSLAARRSQLSRAGAPHSCVATIAAYEAAEWLIVGDIPAVRRGVRAALGSDPGLLADVSVRLTAARMAAMQSHASEAAAHLGRADELVDGRSGYLATAFALVRAHVHLAAGEPDAAFSAAKQGVDHAPAGGMSEWLVPVAARALADLAQRARDAGTGLDHALARVAAFELGHPDILRRGIGETPPVEAVALLAIYRAEIVRARAAPEAGERWERTSELCREAGLPWDEAYACMRGVEAELTHRAGSRERAATLARRGVELARQLDAVGMSDTIESLAGGAHIPVDGVPSQAMSEPGVGQLPQLTAREREILEHIVAGRTYSEIARTLVISEKTVSSHVSNLLRKTGSSNRVDLARRATRAPQR